MRRMAEAVSAAGIDTRSWCDYAVIDDVDDSVAVEAGGVFVDVTTPDGKELTCRWGMAYSSPDGASYWPPQRGQEVVVLFPNGNERSGPVAYPSPSNEEEPFPLAVNGREVDGTFPFVRVPGDLDWEVEFGGEVRIQGSADAPEAARRGDQVQSSPTDPQVNAEWATWLALLNVTLGAVGAAATALNAFPPFAAFPAIGLALGALVTAVGNVVAAQPTGPISGEVTQGSSKCRIGGGGTPAL